MKRYIFIILFLTNLFVFELHSQPTSEMIDINTGSRITFNNLYEKEPESLYIYKWTLLRSQPENEFYLLKKTDSVSEKKSLNSFFVKRSEMDNGLKIITLVYKEDVMIIKINKNQAGLRISIDDFYFKEGIYSIDLKKLYEKYDSKNINILVFPNDEDMDINNEMNEDRILTID